MSNQALAHVAGALLLKSETPVTLSAEKRATLKRILEQLETNNNGLITVWHRWALLKIDDIDSEELWRQVTHQWMRSERTTFVEFMSFLSGFFTVWDTTTFSGHAVQGIASELERVADGIPHRFQQLFFELTAIVQEYDDPIVDLKIVREALQLHRVTFPVLETNMVQGSKKTCETEPETQCGV